MAQLHRVRHGVAVWSSREWRDEAVAWLDHLLAACGIERTGDVDSPHVRPWATVLRVPTSSGVVWMKAAAPGTAFEISLYELLARTVPDRVLEPIAVDRDRAWIVLPDGGPSIGDRLSGGEQADALVAALVTYAELQLQLAPMAGEILAMGVADMRPSIMPERFDEALDATSSVLVSAEDSAIHRQVAAMRPEFVGWCDQLAESRIPPSLDHNDLHPWNVLGDDRRTMKFYDWGDSVIAHPFATMLVPLQMLQRALDTGIDDPRLVRARSAYLGAFDRGDAGEDLAATLEIACRVAKVARVHTWSRAIRAAHEQGETLEENWARAPFETLASLLDESYVGGA